VDESHQTVQSPQQMSVWLLSLCWALIVPLVAVLAVVMIMNNHPPFPARADAIFWGAIAVAVALRGLSLLLEGSGATAQASSRSHRWIRYCLAFVGGALGVWLVARLAVAAVAAFT